MNRWSPKIEEEILEFWRKNRIYEKWKLSLQGKPKFIYLDGPPYTTGKIHIGHSWGKAIRDAVMKYKRLKGFDVFDRPGFDMHGLPIEVKVEKALGIKTKKDVYKIGPENFVEKARKFSIENMNGMISDFKRLGVFMDWDNPYMTISNEYIESIWYLFKKAYEKGLIYEDEKVYYWCPRCQTTLSKHEIELAEMEPWFDLSEDPSIYVKFKLKDFENKYLVIWTTTPWTLVYNLAVAVNPNAIYVEVEVNNEIWIVAKERLESLTQELKINNYKILNEFSGSELEGKEYIHPFYDEEKEILDKLKEKYPNILKVWVWDDVSLEEGTGLVHIAPGCGPEDQELGKQYNVPAWNTTEEDGEIKEIEAFKGMYAKKDDKKFIEKLKEKGILVYETIIKHYYPMCWRCGSKVIFRPVKQYFFNVQKIKEKLLSDAEKTVWVDNVGKDAFLNVLRVCPDWNISRQRFWGTPLPIWKCKNNHETVIGSVKELEQLSSKKLITVYIIEEKTKYAKDLLKWYTNIYKNVDVEDEGEIEKLLNSIDENVVVWVNKEISDSFFEKIKDKWYVLRYKGENYNITRLYNFDLHKAFLDSLEIKCPKCGESAKRVQDVIDVWIDSGCASWSVFEYPKRDYYDADFIIEGYDQLRGWFYSLSVAGEIALDKIPFKYVYTTGFVKDPEGRKMSKSLGNIIEPHDVIKQFGADTLRYFQISSVGPFKDQIFDINEVRAKYENLNVLWNIHIYLINYSKYLGIDPTKIQPDLDIEEEWILSRLHNIIRQVMEAFENYQVYKVPRFLESLWLDLSRKYIKLTREKLNEGSQKDKEKVLYTIYTVLLEIIKMLSPVCPFISEAIYQNLRKEFSLNNESIFFYNWPEYKEELVNTELEEDFDLFYEILEAGNRLRDKIGISLRWPLRTLYIKTKSEIQEKIKKFERLLKIKLNVKEIEYGVPEGIETTETRNFIIAYDTEQTEDLIEEGIVREITRRLQDMRKGLGLWKGQKVRFYIETESYIKSIINKYKEKLEKTTDSELYFVENIEKLSNIVKKKEFKIRQYHLKIYFSSN